MKFVHKECELEPLDVSPFRYGTLYPFGYRTPGADIYFSRLMADRRTCVVEARFTPYARRRPHWCRYGKQGLEQVWKERYHYFSSRAQGIDDHDDENWLGNRKYRTGGSIELVNGANGLEQLEGLLVSGWNVVLVCGCPEYERCHRKLLVEEVQRVMPFLPVALQPLTREVSLPSQQPQQLQLL